MEKSKTVRVRKAIMKDGEITYIEKTVGAEIAEEQLSLPKEERHPHWRAFEYAKKGRGNKESEEVSAKADADADKNSEK